MCPRPSPSTEWPDRCRWPAPATTTLSLCRWAYREGRPCRDLSRSTSSNASWRRPSSLPTLPLTASLSSAFSPSPSVISEAIFRFATLLGQFNLQKFVSSITQNGLKQSPDSSWVKTLARQLCNKSLYALNLCSEVLVTPDDTVLLSIEGYGDKKAARKKAVLHHKFLHHNLTVEAAWPELFVDGLGTYWDVPFSMAMDLASTASDSGASYHFSINHNAGRPKQHEDQVTNGVPTTLLPGLCIKNAFAFKKTVDFWRSKASKLKLVQPFDMFLSNPHISASGVLGAVLAACLGNNSVGQQIADDSLHFKPISLRAAGVNSTILADMFASASFSMQHGNFQRLFFDLTRFYTRLDFPSGSKFISGTIQLAQHLYNSQQLSLEAIQAICPKATVSLQQQIAGPFTFRVDSGVTVDLKNSGGWQVNFNDPVFAIEYALQVLGSAKAVAWYSPKQKEFMIELRFFET
ncbi:protein TRIGALACTOSYLDIACYLGLYCEROL 4, chloroplastic isoform X2 [Diospyros lotus]|uniref:protein TRIGALACTOSYLDIACYLGLYCEROL 4, chloroplastic isoform X2 n=1 Tax=Diospyros lotus TaxID=55363 RepID=UPI002258F120|nr:protein TRIGALACTOSYLDIACYLGLYCEROL 4, chloroplastic isoform X2 [Diospyros lotus]